MDIRDSKKVGIILPIVILFVVTACGTLEVSTEPEVSGAAPSITDSEVSTTHTGASRRRGGNYGSSHRYSY